MKPVIVSDREDLLKLLRQKNGGFDGDLKLKISRLNAIENEAYERLLNKWLHGCGCETGAVFCFIAICSYMVYWFVKSEPLIWITIRNGLIIIFCAALIGKLTGILVSKIRFRRTVYDLLRKLE